MNNMKTDLSLSLRNMQAALEDMRKQLELLAFLKRLDYFENIKKSDKREKLIKLAMENCTDEAVLKWLKETSKSDTFSKLVDMFDFLKEKIDEEEKKNHGDNVHITLVAHGSIKDFLIPASCFLPLSTITDVVLYSPWNCIATADVTYGIATGKMKPQHRVFYCGKDSCKILNLPNHWNSLKTAGGQLIPNITVSPLRPDDGVWERFETLSTRYGPPGRNRIVIPFILPGKPSESVPFCVITLALSLVLLSSRFKATVHYAACLSDHSTGEKFDRKYLQQQYAWTTDNTGMKCSPDAFRVNWWDYFKGLFD